MQITTKMNVWIVVVSMIPSARKSHPGTIDPTEAEANAGCLELKYSCVEDKYLRAFDSNSVVNGWQNLVYGAESVFRNLEEYDLQMVYLARVEGSEVGKVVWHFDVGARNMCVDRVEVLVESACFNSGSVVWTLCDARNRVVLSPGSQQVFSAFSGCTELRLSAELSGGYGERSWEHAQLFRQNFKQAQEFPLKITLSLRPGELRLLSCIFKALIQYRCRIY